MLNISQQQKLLQKLSPQQIQYLELLQLPILALEQRLKTELETNPLLEEGIEQDIDTTTAEETPDNTNTEEPAKEDDEASKNSEDDYSVEDFMNDDQSSYKGSYAYSRNEDFTEIPQPTRTTLTEQLRQQLGLLNLSPEQYLLGEEIIGNIEDDGYLRRDLQAIVDDVNLTYNFSIAIDEAEGVLQKIQRLEPVGIGARDLLECLLVQLDAIENNEATVEIARVILKTQYEEFTKKHFKEIQKKLDITQEQLRAAIELIQRLNPKPGEGTIEEFQNYIIPDFVVQKVDDEFVIILNDRSVPPLRINKRYRELISRKKRNNASPETREFIKRKFEAAKWFINSIHQRRETMQKVMWTIVELQKDFFEHGEEHLKPMIYKDVAEKIGMDISTISRVVNGKYVQTDYGVYELRYFFSESINTTSGEGISNKQVKRLIKEIIDSEDQDKPYSDEKIASMVQQRGINIARRTVAKYREQMMIPVARLRKKI